MRIFIIFSLCLILSSCTVNENNTDDINIEEVIEEIEDEESLDDFELIYTNNEKQINVYEYNSNLKSGEVEVLFDSEDKTYLFMETISFRYRVEFEGEMYSLKECIENAWLSDTELMSIEFANELYITRK